MTMRSTYPTPRERPTRLVAAAIANLSLLRPFLPEGERDQVAEWLKQLHRIGRRFEMQDRDLPPAA